jgi:hypothetical protein
MLKILKMLIWLVLVLIVVGGLDQFLVRVPPDTPGLSQVQTFYVDFRTRLLGLVGVKAVPAPASIEQVIEATRSAPQQARKPQRYLYVDEAGELQFADSLAQVPSKFRQAAQPLAE